MGTRKGRARSLSKNQRAILIEILNGSLYNSQIAKAVGLNFSVVSREMGGLEDLGLIAKERKDPLGRVKVQLTQKGKSIASTLEEMERLEEIISHNLEPPLNETMTQEEANNLHHLIIGVSGSEHNETLDKIVELSTYLRQLREEGKRFWYADEMLFNFFLDFPSKNIPSKAKIRGLAILNDVIRESETVWARRLEPLVPKLMNIAIDGSVDDDLRTRALQTYCRFRDSDGSVPEIVLSSLRQHLWHFTTPGYKEFFMEDAYLFDNMESICKKLNDDQKMTLVLSLECLKASSKEKLEECMKGKRIRSLRGVDYRRWHEVERFMVRRKLEWMDVLMQRL